MLDLALFFRVCEPYEGTNVASSSFFSLQKRDIFQDLAPLLWYSYGTIAVLLQVCTNHIYNVLKRIISFVLVSFCYWVRLLIRYLI